MNSDLYIFLREQGYFDLKDIPGTGIVGLFRFAYSVAIVCGLDELGYKYRYCYPTLLEAQQGLKEWNGDGNPPGTWIKRKGQGGDLRNPKLV